MTGSLLTADQVAELLGVPRCARIPTVTLGRYRRYRKEAIETWLAELEAPARVAGRNGNAHRS